MRSLRPTGAFSGDYKAAFQFGKLRLRSGGEARAGAGFPGPIFSQCFGYFINPWSRHNGLEKYETLLHYRAGDRGPEVCGLFNDENLGTTSYPAGTVAMHQADANGSRSSSSGRTPRSRRTTRRSARSSADATCCIAAAGDDSQNGPGDGYPNLYTQFFYVQVHPGR